jgi:branched-chain amino acid transport system substrate-binding protein
VGDDAVRAAQLAIDYLDGKFDGLNGSLLGHPVTLAVQSDQCDPVGGVSGAKRLILDPNMLAVLGTTCSGAALNAAAPVLSQHRVLMVSASNTSPKLTDPAEHERYYFRTSFNDLVQGAVVADYAASKLHAKTAATLYTDDAYARLLADAFATAFVSAGGAVVASHTVPVNGSPASGVQAAASARPSMVFVAGYEPPCGRVVRAMRSTSALHDTPVVVAESCQLRQTLKKIGPDPGRLYASGPDYGDLTANPFYAAAFLPAYVDRFGEPPLSVFHATAYDASNLIFSAIRRAATVRPGGVVVINRAKMREAMIETQGYEGISGVLSCLPTGDCDPSTRIAIYRAPEWPQVNPHAKPVFSERKSLADVTARG